jgi:hypothetical protein
VIIGAQVAAAFCLLVGAALVIRTAWHLGQVDLGFDARNVLSANITLHEGSVPTLAGRRAFFQTLIDRLAEMPEIERAGLTGWLPFRIGPSVTVEGEGRPDSAVSAALQGVDAGYFQALGIRVREGRALATEDREGRPRVAVIGRSLARTVWPGESALGRQFRIRFSPEPGRGFGPYTVVGVADDVLQSTMQLSPPQLFVAFYQQPLAANAFLQLKTIGPPLDAAPAVARVVREMNPELALGSVNSLAAIVEAEAMRPRLLARALALFAALAVGIAVVGLYAVSAWIAQRRQREAALRIALGAKPVSVAGALAARPVMAVAVGLLVGWLAAAPLAALVASELRGVSAADLPTRVMVAVALAAISGSALFVPAWRAARGNLAAILRAE